MCVRRVRLRTSPPAKGEIILASLTSNKQEAYASQIENAAKQTTLAPELRIVKVVFAASDKGGGFDARVLEAVASEQKPRESAKLARARLGWIAVGACAACAGRRRGVLDSGGQGSTGAASHRAGSGRSRADPLPL